MTAKRSQFPRHSQLIEKERERELNTDRIRGIAQSWGAWPCRSAPVEPATFPLLSPTPRLRICLPNFSANRLANAPPASEYVPSVRAKAAPRSGTGSICKKVEPQSAEGDCSREIVICRGNYVNVSARSSPTSSRKIMPQTGKPHRSAPAAPYSRPKGDPGFYVLTTSVLKTNGNLCLPSAGRLSSSLWRIEGRKAITRWEVFLLTRLAWRTNT